MKKYRHQKISERGTEIHEVIKCTICGKERYKKFFPKVRSRICVNCTNNIK